MVQSQQSQGLGLDLLGVGSIYSHEHPTSLQGGAEYKPNQKRLAEYMAD
jgi:hypothetical protein